MSAAAKRRGERRRRNRRRVQTLTWEDAAASGQVSRPLRLLAQNFDLLHDYVRNSTDHASALALTEQRLEAAVHELVALTEPYDAFDVLELVRLKNGAANPETFRETEHEGSAAVIELAALILATSSDSRGPLPDVNGHRADTKSIVDQVQAAALECLNAGSMLRLFRAFAITDPLARISFVSVVREVSLRNLAYPHMLEDTLVALFDDPAIEQDCRNAMGTTAAEIRAVLSAATRMRAAAWNERFRAFAEVADRALNVDAQLPLPDAIRAQAVDAWTQAWSDPADASALEPDALAAESGLDVDTVGQS